VGNFLPHVRNILVPGRERKRERETEREREREREIQIQNSLARASHCRLLADPEFLMFTRGIIPAIAFKFCTVFVPGIVGFSFIPILCEAAKTMGM
jgi:hypothetical protein